MVSSKVQRPKVQRKMVLVKDKDVQVLRKVSRKVKARNSDCVIHCHRFPLVGSRRCTICRRKIVGDGSVHWAYKNLHLCRKCATFNNVERFANA